MSAISSAVFNVPTSTNRSPFAKPAPRNANPVARLIATLSRGLPTVATHRGATTDLAQGYARMAAACRARGRHAQADMFDQMAAAVTSAVG